MKRWTPRKRLEKKKAQSQEKESQLQAVKTGELNLNIFN